MIMSLSNPEHTSEDKLSLTLQEAHRLVEVGATYTHFKNPSKPYKVLSIALMEATEEPCVIYQALYGSDFMKTTLWVRALNVWLSEVPFEGKLVPRFQKAL